MNYNINKFFEKEECLPIIEFAEKNGIQFSYTNDSVWDCKRICNDEFKEKILNHFITLYQSKKFDLWFPLESFEIKDINLSLTKYYDGRKLNLHLDGTSQLTTVIVLSEEFHDGRFMLSEIPEDNNNTQKHELKIGESITFDGSQIYHGVMPVTKGIRYALNIWMTNTDYKYLKLGEKKLI